MDKVIAILAVDHVYYSTFSESDWCSLPYYQCLLTGYPKHTHENSHSGYLAGFSVRVLPNEFNCQTDWLSLFSMGVILTSARPH